MAASSQSCTDIPSSVAHTVLPLSSRSTRTQRFSSLDTISSVGKHSFSSIFPTHSNVLIRSPNHQRLFCGNLSGVAAALFWFDDEAVFYRIHPPSDEITLLDHFCGPRPPSTTQGAFSHRTGIIGPSSLRIRIHVGQQGHLRRCMFEQIHPLPMCHPLVLTPASTTCSRSSTSSPLQMS